MPGTSSVKNNPGDRTVVASSPVAAVWLILGGAGMVAAFLWAYWPTLVGMVDSWNREPDYSHGYLVLPIAVFFLWARRSSFPRNDLRPSFVGAILLLLACILRLVAGMYYMIPVDGWTIPIWVAGAVWLLYGKRCLVWSLSSIVFLWFMMPIPYSVERWLSLPAQGLATKVSMAVLQMLGQPALAEGHTIWIGDHQMFIAEACSGLRIFVGIFALAFAFVLFSRWSLWQKALVLLAAAPVAIVANVTRIVVTGLLYRLVSDSAAHKFSHDLCGFIMIPFAALLFWLFLIYLDRLFPEVEEVKPAMFSEPALPNGTAG